MPNYGGFDFRLVSLFTVNGFIVQASQSNLPRQYREAGFLLGFRF